MKIWCLSRDQFAHIQPIQAALGEEAEFVYDSEWAPASLLQAKPDLVLCINDYPFDVARCLDAAREYGIPSLLLQDGILEWRCQFENPLFAAGGGAPQHQPVLADKIACIGHESLRRIAGWGNARKVELTGMPRLDVLCSRETKAPMEHAKRILVMTAKNPGFDAQQRQITIRSLRDLKTHLDKLSHVKTSWRVSRSVAAELDVQNELEQVASSELVNAVEAVDAVISTPSTGMLEAMLLGRPVAALDYHNVPVFVRTAWMIAACEQIPRIVDELLDPPPTKMTFQQETLADNLVCDGSSAHRVCSLIRKMIAFAQRNSLKHCCMPADMLGMHSSYHFFPPRRLSELHGSQSVFQESEAEKMQVRIARAENENARLKTEYAQLKKRLQLGAWVRSGVRRLTASARNL